MTRRAPAARTAAGISPWPVVGHRAERAAMETSFPWPAHAICAMRRFLLFSRRRPAPASARLPRLPCRCCRKNRGRCRKLWSAARPTRRVLVKEKIRGVDRAFRLRRDRLDDCRMRIAERVHPDSAQEIQIGASPSNPKSNALAVGEQNRMPIVGREQKFALRLPARKSESLRHDLRSGFYPAFINKMRQNFGLDRGQNPDASHARASRRPGRLAVWEACRRRPPSPSLRRAYLWCQPAA